VGFDFSSKNSIQQKVVICVEIWLWNTGDAIWTRVTSRQIAGCLLRTIHRVGGSVAEWLAFQVAGPACENARSPNFVRSRAREIGDFECDDYLMWDLPITRVKPIRCSLSPAHEFPCNIRVNHSRLVRSICCENCWKFSLAGTEKRDGKRSKSSSTLTAVLRCL